MPEYLAPGVSVEEVDRGSKTIEGGSTSTAAMVGATERGPIDVPIFLSSFADYRRWFGGHLNPKTTDRWHLPSAVEGFFANGGKRLFVTRVAATSDTQASSGVFNSQGDGTVLLASPVKAKPAPNKPQTFFLPIGESVGADAGFLKIGIEGAEIAKTNPPNPSSYVMLLKESLTGEEKSPKWIDKTTELEVAADVNAKDQAIIIEPPTNTPNPKKDDYVKIGERILLVKEWDAQAKKIKFDSDVKVSLIKGQVITLLTAYGSTPTEASELSAGMKAICFTNKPTKPTSSDNSAPIIIGVVFETGTAPNTQYRYIQRSKYYQCDLGGAPAELKSLKFWSFQTDSTISNVTLTNGVLVFQANPPKINDFIRLKSGEQIQIVKVTELAGKNATVSPAIQGNGPFDVCSHVATDAKARVFGVSQGQSRRVYFDWEGTDSPTHVTLSAEGGEAFAIKEVTPEVIEVSSEAPDVNLSKFSVGSVVQPGNTLFKVKALDTGCWGNRLRVRTELPDQRLVQTEVISGASGKYRLTSSNGIEAGTWLHERNASTNASTVVRVLKVTKTEIEVSPDPGWSSKSKIQSLEFNLFVQLVSDDAGGGKPSVLASEVFSGLSLDKEHSRFVQKIVGATQDTSNPLVDTLENPVRRSDGRTMGESQLVRIDFESATLPSLCLPDGPIQDPVSGRKLPVWKTLYGGKTDKVTESDIVGQDDIEPAKRTGLHTLRNEDDISLVSCPGWTDQVVQQALIEHCEQMKYRFAVLDGEGPGKDDLGSIKDLRSRYDSKYAAIYHPWVLISNPFQGFSGKSELACPPSGHVMGLIAEVDVRRGVHKAPANEVLRGVVGLQRKLQKAEQELLNPFPSNLNVIRDFRSENRGIRVWGARVITSDPDWKYINVRRLFNFVEKSIERGMQWVVFEPNDEPLWARVRQTISSFLKTVWRDGALQGRTPEEAFFVVADRTTMTQDDINNGRLIVEVGIAPVKPAEFVIIRIGMYTANAEN